MKCQKHRIELVTRPGPNPDHSLKIFKADQSSKFLLVNQNTSAREVVMLALTEFGISENSSNYHLVEVSGVSAKTLHPNTTNLAERIGLASRYYIKNVMSSEQLIPEDVAAELAKESKVDLIQVMQNAEEIEGKSLAKADSFYTLQKAEWPRMQKKETQLNM